MVSYKYRKYFGKALSIPQLANVKNGFFTVFIEKIK